MPWIFPPHLVGILAVSLSPDHCNFPAIHLPPVFAMQGVLCIAHIKELYIGKSPWLASVVVPWDVHILHRTITLEDTTQIFGSTTGATCVSSPQMRWHVNSL